MKFYANKTALWFFALALWLFAGIAGMALAQGTDLLNTKKEAEARGFAFYASRDEIIAKAKEEGRVRVLSNMDPENIEALRKAFMKQYPFIDARAERIAGVEGGQRFALELQAGRSNWDVFEVAQELYQDFLPQLKKFDILGMAKQGVLQIPGEIIDPTNRNVVSLATTIYSLSYNKNLVAPERVPNRWEDFLRPEFKGRKFMVEIRPTGMATLAAGLGEEWMLDYARKLKDQDPVWVRGVSRAITAITTGEQAMLHLSYYHSCIRAKRKDVSKALECKLIEPVPVRTQEMTAVAQVSPYSHAALLWLEFQISPAAQAIIESREPKTSVFVPGSEAARVTMGKKLAVNSWDTLPNSNKWEKNVLNAFGLPRANMK
jgi:ABC-type Fe3+ transport system substrate-binding protein